MNAVRDTASLNSVEMPIRDIELAKAGLFKQASRTLKIA